MMRIMPQPRVRHAGSTLDQVIEGFAIVARKPALMGLLGMIAIVGVFGFSYGVMMPVFARDVFPMGALDAEKAKGYGLLLSASGLGALAGALVLATIARMQQKSRLVIGGAMLFAMSLFAFASMSGFWPAAACLVAVGIGSILMTSTGNSLVQTSVPHEVRGRVMGVWTLIFVGATPLGSLQIAYLAGAYGAPTAVRIGAVVCAGCAVVAFLAIRAMRRSATPPPA
jgi:MFS family permease